MPTPNPAQDNFKVKVVSLILDRQTENALELLSEVYSVDVPKLKVGLPKGHIRRAYGTYTAKNQTISVLDSDIFGNPFVILHEFYHHLRSRNVDKQHRGTEKNADRFAVDFLREYQLAAAKVALEKGI
jgi:Zn-dependent peptidase ImmA (M78 family)